MNKIDQIWIYVRIYIRIVWKFSLNWKNVSRLFTIETYRDENSSITMFLGYGGKYATLFKITLADFTFKVHFMSLVFSVAPRPGITRLQIRFTPPPLIWNTFPSSAKFHDVVNIFVPVIPDRTIRFYFFPFRDKNSERGWNSETARFRTDTVHLESMKYFPRANINHSSTWYSCIRKKRVGRGGIVKIAKPYRNEFLFFKIVTTKYLFVSTLVINASDKEISHDISL